MSKKTKKRKKKPQKKINFIHFLPLAIIVVAYLVTRLYNILIFPPYCDELGTLVLAKTLLRDPMNNLFISIGSIGFPPAMIWLYALIMKFFANPVLAGRLGSVLFGGLPSAILIFLIGKKLFNPMVGFLSALLYILSPFALFLDRTAYTESLVNMAALLVIYSAVLLREKQSIRYWIYLGLALSVGIWIKTTAILFIAFPIVLLAFKLKPWKKMLPLLISYSIMTIFLTFLLTRPGSSLMLQSGAESTYRINELLAFPLNHWFLMAKRVGIWFDWWLTIPYITFFSVVTFYTFYRKDERVTRLVLCSVFPLIFLILNAKGLQSRYLLFTVSPFIIVVAFGLDKLSSSLAFRMNSGQQIRLPKRLKTQSFLLVVLFIIVIILQPTFDLKLWTDPSSAPLSYFPDKGGWGCSDRLYVEGAVSGYGALEAVDYLKDIIDNNPGKPFVILSSYQGTALWAPMLYLSNEPNTAVVFWQGPVFPRIPRNYKVYALLASYDRAAPDANTIYGTKPFLEANPQAILLKTFPQPLIKMDFKNFYQIYSIPPTGEKNIDRLTH